MTGKDVFFFCLVFILVMGVFFIVADHQDEPNVVATHNPPIQAEAPPETTSAQQSQSLVDSIKYEEGFRSKPYQDTEGVVSIGYGLNLTNGITRAEAEWLLRSRLYHAAHCLRARLGALLPDELAKLRAL